MGEIANEERAWMAPVSADDEDRPRCITCRFFRRKNNKCQRLPPTLIFDVNTLERVTAFPAVNAEMWCGEYASTGTTFLKDTPNG